MQALGKLAHALAAAASPPHLADPFDRLLIAQARAEGRTPVTRGPRFLAHGVALLRA